MDGVSVGVGLVTNTPVGDCVVGDLVGEGVVGKLGELVLDGTAERVLVDGDIVGTAVGAAAPIGAAVGVATTLGRASPAPT